MVIQPESYSSNVVEEVEITETKGDSHETKDKVGIVTGGAGGIGRGIALAMAKEGAILRL